MEKGVLYLIPTVIAPNTESKSLPTDLVQLCSSLDYYLVENIRTARRCLSAMNISKPIPEITFHELSKKTEESEIAGLMQPLFEGKSIGIMSEAGCPGIADPGSKAVSYAHAQGIRVEPWVGPSSIFLALMASGFSGQSFAFSGYLPIDKKEKTQAIRALEQTAFKTGQTQIFMETPYRNNQLVEDIVKICSPQLKLCIAKDINGVGEMIKTDTIQNWKKSKPDLHKSPCIFLFGNN
ncbi:SAM-dependent methyltransferase [Marivirga harenae]|uniref:SAM-dependent methyltransferase n=1 Tax=Marivirga harenae TaxID=2010992 RepID=UPI0026E03B4B|nr:SAM-dependent methyltransferase [Marivirga harenae]WKV13625.1 SAM-dependent methyltransferase [Marivirga harenae]|tara:strand:+ start:269655 stop:270365 length:711 start_codon:yes stop_codon:yes gene_type:complete